MSNVYDPQLPQPKGRQQNPSPDIPEDFLSPPERQQLQRMMGYPEDLPKAFKSFLQEYLSVNPPDIPVSSLRGFTGFRPTVATSDSVVTGNSAYTDLAGPVQNSVPAGQYLMLHGYGSAEASDPGDPGIAFAAPTINDAAIPGDADAAISEGSSQSSMFYRLATLTEASNSVKLLFRVQGGTGTRTWNRPFLILLKIGN